MRFHHDGITLWYGTRDAPAPLGAVSPQSARFITAAVQPIDPSHQVEVHLRLTDGSGSADSVLVIPAPWLRTDPYTQRQYFRANLPELPVGARVSYRVLCRGSGRIVPSPTEMQSFAIDFVVASKTPVRSRALPPILFQEEKITNASGERTATFDFKHPIESYLVGMSQIHFKPSSLTTINAAKVVLTPSNPDPYTVKVDLDMDFTRSLEADDQSHDNFVRAVCLAVPRQTTTDLRRVTGLQPNSIPNSVTFPSRVNLTHACLSGFDIRPDQPGHVFMCMAGSHAMPDPAQDLVHVEGDAMIHVGRDNETTTTYGTTNLGLISSLRGGDPRILVQPFFVRWGEREERENTFEKELVFDRPISGPVTVLLRGFKVQTIVHSKRIQRPSRVSSMNIDLRVEKVESSSGKLLISGEHRWNLRGYNSTPYPTGTSYTLYSYRYLSGLCVAQSDES